jgi:hypothetical protein
MNLKSVSLSSLFTGRSISFLIDELTFINQRVFGVTVMN